VTGWPRRCAGTACRSRSSPTTARCSPAGSAFPRPRCSSTGSAQEFGIEHLLTAPRSPTTTGKIERFHRSLRAECLTGQLFASLPTAQAAVNEWVEFYNTQRPHQSLQMGTPAERFGRPAAPQPVITADRSGDDWVCRRVGAIGVVCVSWQQVSVGKHHAGARCDVQVGNQPEEDLSTINRIWTAPPATALTTWHVPATW
jgi:hypothetical protein